MAQLASFHILPIPKRYFQSICCQYQCYILLATFTYFPQIGAITIPSIASCSDQKEQT
jgi:hypothetical protein